MEDQLRQIWASALSLEPEEIGQDDNLFELGGDSVKAIQIMAKAAENQLYFDIQTLYANPTVGSLVKALGQGEANGHHLPVTTENNKPADDDMLLRVRRRMEELGIPGVRALRAAKLREDQVDFIHMTAKGAIGASPTFIYEVEGGDVRGELLKAIALVTLKHPILRSTFVDVDGEYYQVALDDAAPVLLGRSGPIKQYAHEASTRVLAAGDPTAHYALVDDNGTLFFSFSVLHCFFDSFSRTIIERDLVAALGDPGALAGQPERPWYGDFASHLEANLDEASAEAFWLRYLEGSSRVDTIHQGPPGAMRQFDRSIHETMAADVAQGRQIHLATAITTAWALALMHRSGSRDVAFTLLTLGRLYPYEGMDRLVGLLVKDRPFRLQLADDDDDAAAAIDSVLLGVQGDLVSAGEYEHGPRFPRGPCLQSYVNIKLGGSAMEATAAGGLTLTPRRDLERWESETRYAVYLEVKPLGGRNRFEMRYHSSLIGDEEAAALLGRFLALLEGIGGSAGGRSVAGLLEEL